MSTVFHKRYRDISREGYSADQLGKHEIARLQMIEDLIPSSVKYILDAGCGEGIITNPLNNKGKDILGLDISYPSLRYIKSKKIQSSIEQMPFMDGTFDLVLSSSVLEHLPYDLLLGTAKELDRVSREYILVSTPYKEVLWKSLTRCPRCRSIYHKNLHLHSFDEDDLIKLFPNCTVEMILFGAPEDKKAEALIWIAQHIFYRYAYSATAIRCPVCGLVFSKITSPENLVSNRTTRKEIIGKLINTMINKVSWFRKRHPTHVAILLRKKSSIQEMLTLHQINE
jgi:SAM-dependent methyltransferase